MRDFLKLTGRYARDLPCIYMGGKYFGGVDQLKDVIRDGRLSGILSKLDVQHEKPPKHRIISNYFNSTSLPPVQNETDIRLAEEEYE